MFTSDKINPIVLLVVVCVGAMGDTAAAPLEKKKKRATHESEMCASARVSCVKTAEAQHNLVAQRETA